MSDLLQRYDDYAIRHKRAFDAFKDIYRQTNPPPVKQAKTFGDRLAQFGMTRVVLLVLTIASVIVSGAHTIPTVTQMFGEELDSETVKVVSIFAFIMVELGMLGYSFISARRRLEKADIDDDDEDETGKLLTTGKRLAFSVAIAANVYNVLTPLVGETGGWLWDSITLGVTLLIGVSAPWLAFIAGEGFAIQAAYDDRRSTQEKAVHDQAMRDWNEQLLTAWNSQKSRWGATIKVEKAEISTLPDGVSTVTNTAEIAGNLPDVERPVSPTVQKVLDHLEIHPDHINLSGRKLAVEAKVSHPVASEAREIYLKRQR